jgi:hypothetical protein
LKRRKRPWNMGLGGCSLLFTSFQARIPYRNLVKMRAKVG